MPEGNHIKKPKGTGVLGDDCGHHCGVITTGMTDKHVAHCNCKECHGPVGQFDPDISAILNDQSGMDTRGIR